MRTFILSLICCLVSVAAFGQTTTHSASLTWGPVTAAGATYNVLRASTSGGVFTAVKTGLTSASYVDLNLAANTAFCYEITTSIAGMTDSAPTAPACGSTKPDGAPTPGGPVIVIFQ